MARALKGKPSAGKATAATASATAPLAKRRKKKQQQQLPLADAPAMRRSASASSGSSSGEAEAAPSVAGSGGGTPSAHGKECEQCGNCMVLEGVSAARAWPSGKKSSVSTGCQICDFVAFRKAQRPCVHCARSGCDHFCDWCGHGFHTKCARARDENIANPDGFSCRKCEMEQDNPGDTSASDDDGDEEEVGARCGSCRLPFNGAAPLAKGHDDGKVASPSGFRVNQSVLVDNEDMLYNAVITAVDTKGERIKIHFIRWSKSFDDWYAMDDERINESLACDCCNQWFHIGCLPPIKSSGRWKESTYVCPTCIEDARAFHNGNRAVLKAKTAYISTSVAIANTSSNNGKGSRKGSSEDGEPASTKAPGKGKRGSAKANRDDDASPTSNAKEPAAEKSAGATTSAPVAGKRKRKLSETSSCESPLKKKEAPTAARKRAGSSPSVGSEEKEEAVDSSAKPAASPQESPTVAETVSDVSKSPVATVTSTPADKNTPDEASPARKDESASSPRNAPQATATPAQASPKVSTEKPVAVAHSSPSKAVEAKVSSTPTKKAIAAAPVAIAPASAPKSNDQTPITKPKVADGKGEETHRRRGSGHSMSSLLNSPAPEEERPQVPARPTMILSSLPMVIPARSSKESIKMMVAASLPPPACADLPVKLERDLFPASRGKAAKKEPSARSRATKKTPASARGSLSAFDILREVAQQSMGDEIPDKTPGGKAKRERPGSIGSQAEKRVKIDAATSTSSPAQAGASVPNADSDRMVNATRERIQMNSFVDLHFNIRKEMYLRFCRLEEEGLLTRDTAHMLRALIYPTSEKFQDLKFVYLVNKDLPSDQLTKRLLEVVPAASGKGPAAALAAALLPPPPGPHHHQRMTAPPLSSMSLFSAGVSRNVSPAGTPRMSLLPPGSSLTDRLAESAIRSPLRASVVSGPAPIPSSIKPDPPSKDAAPKRPDMLLAERARQAAAAAAAASVSNTPAQASAQLISR